ncbi:Nitrogen permease reactivator protein [Cyberlindnera fabianii]|uniref:non-specific serine/threonine protein kinase n=1 Tax=Cyberlindnera fabianii TaxID=36022 RepID=A0A1V2LCT0_CYBFA|nr:Nitrogen permease reactivator protein [Cyberlindnera fabianii]
MTSSPVSSLTKLLQQKQHERKPSTGRHSGLSNVNTADEGLSQIVSIEGVEVPTYDRTPQEEDLAYDEESSSPLEFGNARSSYNQRSPITINPSSYSTAPPIRAPMSTSIHRQPSTSNVHHYNNSYSAGSMLSSSIPYSVPNHNGGQSSGNSNSGNGESYTSPRHSVSGLPSNITMIESTNIISPTVDTSSIEPRFVISKQKVQQVRESSSSFSRSVSSGSGFFTRSRKGSQMDLGSFYNNPTTVSMASPAAPQATQMMVTDTTISSSPSSISSMESSMSKSKQPHGSMVDLKRFFKKAPSSHSPLNASNSFMMSPVSSGQFSRERSGSVSSSYNNNVSAYTTPQALPFSKRYGKFGDSLGAGAGGSVKLIKRLSDSIVFAVKEFRPRSSTETRRDYAKKITGEYCIGSTLRHPNIIETIEIAYENDRIMQVMEYCDYDLFAIVMSNKMSSEEIDCCFKQILTGIQYLHHMGLAHRDLKLDNCVINAQGIVKIIDFGSAVVFSYPFSQTLIEASGIVGSDPYLSPETLVFSKYDPRPVDIWSAAMIYCCMVLKKFPWKVPKLSDNSFKLFCTGRDSDSLSALLTKAPPPKPAVTKPVGKPSGLSNLTKAFSKPLAEIENGVVTATPSNETEVPSSADNTATPTPETVVTEKSPVPSSKSYDSSHSGTTTATPPQSVTAPGKTPASATLPASDSSAPKAHTSNLIGEARLLQALPEHTRSVIGRMVDLAPACRATIDEVMSDSWVESLEMCTVEEHVDGSGISKHIYHRAKNHTHTQVDQSEAHIASLEKKKKQQHK